jgi:hypothetical protein
VTTPEVAAAAPQRPEQVRVTLAAGRAELAVGADDLGLDQVVGRPAEPAGQVAEAAAQGEAGHADLGDEPERGGQAVGLGGPVDVGQPAARPDVGQPGLGVDGELAQAGQVDGQAALGDRRPGDVVAAALDPEQQAVGAGEADGGGHVGGRGRLEDQRRGGRGQAVPDPHGVVPARVVRPQQPALDPPGQVLQGPGGHGHRPAGLSAELDRGRGHRPALPGVADGRSCRWTVWMVARMGVLLVRGGAGRPWWHGRR